LSNRVTLINEHRRLELCKEVYALAVQRLPHTEIGKQLGIDRRTVAKYYAEESERRQKGRRHDAERERAISTYEVVIAKGFAVLEALGSGKKPKYLSGAQANALVGATNSIISAQSRIDTITGIEAPRKKAIEAKVYGEGQPIPLERLSPGLILCRH
jgi:hypothetical protein